MINLKNLPLVIRWISYILGGAVLAFFLTFLIGEGIGDMKSPPGADLSRNEILGLTFVGLSLLGLFIAFFKQRIGGIVALLAGLGLIIALSLDDKKFFYSIRAWPFYMFCVIGILHIVSSFFRKTKPNENPSA